MRVDGKSQVEEEGGSRISTTVGFKASLLVVIRVKLSWMWYCLSGGWDVWVEFS